MTNHMPIRSSWAEEEGKERTDRERIGQEMGQCAWERASGFWNKWRNSKMMAGAQSRAANFQMLDNPRGKWRGEELHVQRKKKRGVRCVPPIVVRRLLGALGLISPPDPLAASEELSSLRGLTSWSLLSIDRLSVHRHRRLLDAVRIRTRTARTAQQCERS
jgi:hypothetical protein